MAEIHSVPRGAPNPDPVDVCAECGEPLAGAAGGGEELCRYCDEAQFEPTRTRLGERPNGRRHHVR